MATTTSTASASREDCHRGGPSRTGSRSWNTPRMSELTETHDLQASPFGEPLGWRECVALNAWLAWPAFAVLCVAAVLS